MNCGKKSKQRPSRLCEGTRARPLDFQVAYDGKISEAEILTGASAASRKILSIDNCGPSHWRNRLYLGDNLGLLRSFLVDANIHKKIKLVYIDPPFATGTIFASRTGERAYEDLHHGAAYLEFLRQRLVVIRELLHPAGSIYLHLDDTMAFAAKMIMDEIFGPANFRNWITRKKSNRKNSTTRRYGNISDYLLFYTMTDEYVWNRPFDSWTDEWAAREYPYIEKNSGRRYKKVPVHAPGIRNGETGKEWRGKLPPPGKHWQYPPRRLDEFDSKGEIYWSPTKNPRRKLYFDQSLGVPIQDIWLDCRDAHNQMIEVTGYPTEKPLGMLQRIVQASSNPGDIVLDCFAGSGTTLVAAEELGRQWVGIDSGVEAVTTMLRRLANGTEPMGDFVSTKKKKQPSLLTHPSALRTNCDLFVESQLDVPERLSVLWKELFGTKATSCLSFKQPN